MTTNSDGTVTTKTPGKVAATPTGSGTAQVETPAAKKSTPGPKVVRVKGRGPAARSAKAH